ncbi:MAG TPA: transcription antitermination factor NusB [Rhizomicrobium sp.]|nr:transcription antitermination factor NusB [Rhizomicrobium sp.]
MNGAGTGARTAAQQALTATLRRKYPLDLALDEAIAAHALASRDGGFARAIANETMRRFGQLEDLVRRFVPRPPPPHRAGPTLEILLAAACELLFLDVPPHAAVDGANRLAASDPKAVHFKPLINAALRRIAREGQRIVDAQEAPRLNTPDWLWTRWCAAYGEETTRSIARIHAQTPPLDLHFHCTPAFPPPPQAGEGDREAVEGAFALSEGPLRPFGAPPPRFARGRIILFGDVIRLEHAGNIEELEGFAEGAFWVQDFAAGLPARLFGNVRGRRVIDLCAAPGGKTAQLAAAGADVTAVERDEIRLARLEDNLERLKLDARIVLADVRDYTPEQLADCVLLDAPCSATGTIRRHPELPWIKNAADIAACSDAAAELLDAAAAMVAPGGTLIFVVCSLEPEEGPEQIAHFQRQHDEFRREPVTADEIFGLSELITSDGDLRTLPCHLAGEGGMDGFYAARLTRS